MALCLYYILINFLSVIFHFTNSFFNHDESIKLSIMLLNYIFSCLNIQSFFKSAWSFERMLLLPQDFYSIFISLTFYCWLFYILYHPFQYSKSLVVSFSCYCFCRLSLMGPVSSSYGFNYLFTLPFL